MSRETVTVIDSGPPVVGEPTTYSLSGIECDFMFIPDKAVADRLALSWNCHDGLLAACIDAWRSTDPSYDPDLAARLESVIIEAGGSVE